MSKYKELITDPDTGEEMGKKEWVKKLGVSTTAFYVYCQKNGNEAAIKHFKNPEIKKRLEKYRAFFSELLADPETGEKKSRKEWARTFGIKYDTFYSYCLKHGIAEAFRYYKYGISRSPKRKMLKDPDTGEKLSKKEWVKKLGVSTTAFYVYCQKNGNEAAIKHFKSPEIKKRLEQHRAVSALLADPETGEKKSRKEWARTFGIKYDAFCSYCLKHGIAEAFRYYKYGKLRSLKEKILNDPDIGKKKRKFLKDPDTGENKSIEDWAKELLVTQNTISNYCNRYGTESVIRYYKRKLKDIFRIIAEDADSYGITKKEFLAYRRKHGEGAAIRHLNIPLNGLFHAKVMTDPDTGERKTKKKWAILLGISKVTFDISCRAKGEKKAIQYYKKKMKEKFRMIEENADDYGILRSEFLAYSRKHGEGAAISYFKLKGKWTSQTRMLKDPDTGERKCISAWARELGASQASFSSYCKHNGTKGVIQHFKAKLKEEIRMIEEDADVYGISREEFFAYCRKHGEGAATRHFKIPATGIFRFRVMTDPDTGERKTAEEWANLFAVSQYTFRAFCLAKGEKKTFQHYKKKLKEKIRMIEKNTDDYGISREELSACCREYGEGFAIKQFDLSQIFSSGSLILTDPDTGIRKNLTAWAKEFGVTRAAISAYCQRKGPNKTIQYYKNKSRKLKERLNSEKKTLTFIRKAQMVHGNLYEYNRVRYVKSLEPVRIYCKVHGYFSQTPTMHLRGFGCAKCKNKNR